MNLRLVEYFVAVVDHGGITKAAHALYLAQPSLSQAIRTLERQLGVQLFDRSGGKLVLTADGRAFLEPARTILKDIDIARQKVHSVRDGITGRLVVTAQSTLAVDPLPELIKGLRENHPAIRVTVLDPTSPTGLVDHLRRGIAEIGLADLPLSSEGLEVRQMWEQELCLVLPPAIAVELPDPVPIEAVSEIPLVIESGSDGPNAAIEAILGKGVAFVAVECVHRDAIWELVGQGAGATFLPRPIAETELHDVVVRSTTPKVHRPVGIAFRRGPLSPAADAFMQVAQGLSSDRGPE
ncbi:LysR family transcriptional regulator [Nocardia sp. NPDC004123]